MITSFIYFFFDGTAPTKIYTFPYTTLFRSGPPPLVLGAQRILCADRVCLRRAADGGRILLRNFDPLGHCDRLSRLDRKSTRLNSSHSSISYAVFCLKKKKHLKR